MSYYTESADSYLSHPNKLLKTHLLNVGNNSKNIFNNLCIKNKNLYADLSFLIGVAHDFGKSTTYFQNYISDLDNPKFRTIKKRHSRISGLFGYYIVKEYFKKTNEQEKKYPVLSYIIINRHHGNLIDIKGSSGEINKLKEDNLVKDQIDNLIKQKDSLKYKDFANFYNEYNIDINNFIENFTTIKKEVIKDLRKIYKEKRLENYEELLILYSALIDSDKLDASQTNTYQRKDISPKVIEKYKEKYLKNDENHINQIREDAFNEVNSFVNKMDLNNKIYSLTLPTGSGKTLDILSFSLNLRERIKKELNFKPNIIYALPFLSIIDQNADVIEKLLNTLNYNGSDYFLKHTSLSDLTYNPSDSNDDDSLNYNSSKLLLDGWYSEIVITTFIQLFYTLITNKNKSLRKFHNLSNSIIILDEVQSIPPKYWDIVKSIFNYISKEYNTWIIFMTATQPMIFNSEEIIEITENTEKYIEEFDRINYIFHDEPISIDNFCIKVIEEIENNEDKNIMIVLNTIASSKKVYDYILENIDDREILYLSTNIIPKDRLERINQIKEETYLQKIIVTTQLIEAGVDIDVDIIYRDQAPLDSIIQTAGRCNRNNENDKGIVHVIKLKNDNDKFYSNFVYNKVLLSATNELTENIGEISEKEFNKEIASKYYKMIKERTSAKESRELLNKLKELELSNIDKDFELIEDMNTIDVFVEKDDKAIEIWKIYEEMKNNYNKRKFNEIKPQFYNYVIHINNRKIGTINYDEDQSIGYISYDDLNRKYDENTGFKDEEDEDAFII